MTSSLAPSVRATVAVALVLGLVDCALLPLGALASTGPTVVLTSTTATTTASTTIPITATFSEAVSGFTAASLNLTNASSSDFAGSGAVYTFNVHPLSAGTLTMSVPAAAASSTASSTPSQASNTLSFTYTPASSSPAVISNVSASAIASTTATITWNTDQPTDGQVFYGTTASYNASSTLVASTSTSHVAFLGGLLPSTTYHFQARSNNGAALATSSDMTFTTTGTATSTPFTLIGVDAVRGTATPDGSFSDGWEWTFHFSVPSQETSLAFKLGTFVNQGNASSTISIAGNARYFSPQVPTASTSASALMINGADTYGTTSLNLVGNTATTTSGSSNKAIDVVVDVAVPSGTQSGTYSASFGALTLP